MQRLEYKLQFHTYWHCGSGLAAGADVDALVVKDKNGLPFVPGKTIKGLVRQAFEEILGFESSEETKNANQLLIKRCFGFFDDKDDNKEGELFFSNATMKNIDGDFKKYLFSSVAQTSINDDGIAKRQSLRKIQVVVPCALEGYISNVSKDILEKLQRALKFIKRLGSNRSRGLGRCSFVPDDDLTEVSLSTEKQQFFDSSNPLKFKCTLLSDVILNVKSASEGNNKTLDYIPGSCFMGIVANRLFDAEDSSKDDPDVWDIIQSSKVKFGDAHPAIDNFRTVRIPAVFQLKKGVKLIDASVEDKEFYNSLNQEKPSHDQFKQCRNGFFSFEDGVDTVIANKTERQFAIKSAYDRGKLRSADSRMYGYESLQKGQSFLFSVDCPVDLRKKVYNSLIGIQRIGRSRTSQYGQVEITLDYNFVENQSNFDKSEDNLTYIYADSRLVFVDENTLEHTLQPNEVSLGLVNGKILWDKSQVLTFQYSPWNYARQCYDTDRVGFDKGSVIVVENAEFKTQSGYVGSYQNEGFGKVIVNPEFLLGGRSYHFDSNTGNDEDEIDHDNLIIPYLVRQKEQEDVLREIYCEVEGFVSGYHSIFNGFKNQWGTIRSWAMRYPDCDMLEAALFDPEVGYLMHGRSAKKWEERNRRVYFKAFFDHFKEDDVLKEFTSRAVINLAAQIAKIIK